MMNILINAKSQDSAIKAAKDQELFKAGLPGGIDTIEAYMKRFTPTMTQSKNTLEQATAFIFSS